MMLLPIMFMVGILSLSAQNQKPVDTRINIKPVCPWLIHTENFTGPCRVSPAEPLTSSETQEEQKKQREAFLESLKENISSNARILSPVTIEYDPSNDFNIEQDQWEKLEEEMNETDAIMLSGYIRAYGIGKYHKPVINHPSHGVGNVDIASYLRYNGVEGYAPYDWEDLDDLIALLRVRKAVQQTKLLYLTDRPGGKPTFGVKSIIPADILEEKYGIDFKYVSFAEFLDEWDRVTSNQELQKKAKQIADNLVRNAEAVHIKKENIINDVNFYLTVKEIMKTYDCNSFTVDCFEFCPTKIPYNKKFNPCLTHSLLKDEGYPSVCEGDLNALLAMAIEMYLADKSAYMGNPNFDRDENIMSIHHSDLGLKFKGLDRTEIPPYEIQYFTEDGVGTIIRYDFTLDKGETVTFARFNPAGTKLLVSSGTIVRGTGMDLHGCGLTIHVKIPDAARFFKEQANTGHHLSVVYGDYTQELKQLGEIMGFETICIE